MTVKDTIGQVFDKDRIDLSIVDKTTEKNQEITDKIEMVVLPFRTTPKTAECLRRLAALNNKDINDFINDDILVYFFESVIDPEYIWAFIDSVIFEAGKELHKGYWSRFEPWPKSE